MRRWLRAEIRSDILLRVNMKVREMEVLLRVADSMCTQAYVMSWCNLIHPLPDRGRQFNLSTCFITLVKNLVWESAVMESSIMWDQTEESHEDGTEKTRQVKSCIIYGHLNKSSWRNELDAVMEAKWGFTPYCAGGSSWNNATFRVLPTATEGAQWGRPENSSLSPVARRHPR